MSRIQTAQWSKLRYVDPERSLIALRETELRIANLASSGNVRRLRTNRLKQLREARDAALFAHGLSMCVVDAKICVAVYKGTDCGYDAVFRWTESDTEMYCPVQLKEVPPGDVNSTDTATDLVDHFRKYNFPGLVGAVKLGRKIPGLDTLHDLAKDLPIKELWLFWASSPGQSRWGLYGDVLREPRMYGFDYPGLVTPSAT